MASLRQRRVWLGTGLVALALSACGAPPPARHGEPPPAVVERAFGPGGRVNMHLSAGKYTIEPSPDGQLRLSWTTRDPGDRHKVRIDVQAAATEATVRTEGPSNNFEVVVAVPPQSNLWVRLTAGDLTIRGIEGHKDLSGWAGEFKVAVGDGSAYRQVRTSVLAGEIAAPTLKRTTGGVFRSFEWDGPGKYDLRVRLTAGEIQLRDN